jgi:hypothetical protein
MLDQIHGTMCVHSFQGVQCKNPAHQQKTNGWLCAGHYQQMQQSIPQKPRLVSGKWTGLVPMTDEQVIAGIIAGDATAITLGKVHTLRRGALDPVYLRTLEPTQIQ